MFFKYLHWKWIAMVKMWKHKISGKCLLGDKIWHRLSVIWVAMCCLDCKTTEKGILSFVLGIVKERRWGGNGFVVDIGLFDF